MSGLFENLAANEGEDRAANRKALLVATKRVNKRFARFIANDPARIGYVEDEIRELVREACEEFGATNVDAVTASTLNALQEGFTVEARKPKLCPVHREVLDISLGTGEPQAGYNAMSQQLLGEQSCRGGWDGGRCNFKPEMVTQKYWDDKETAREERRQQREQERLENPVETPAFDAEVQETEPVLDATDLGGEEASEVEVAEAPAADDRVPVMAASAQGDQLGAIERQDVEKDTKPTLDKRKWTPENVQKRVDTEMAGTPHPTREQDIAEPAVYANDDDFLEQTRAVTETQDVTQASGFSQGQQGGSQNTVRSSWNQKIRSSVDPDTNPIHEALLSDAEIHRALTEFNER